MYKNSIGLVGGFGAYATLSFYSNILEKFKSESERNYPRIIMDNNFTMPSRTRALLYDENVDDIVESIASSVKWLYEGGADKIILVCGTAHYFFSEVINLVPEAEKALLNMIEIMAKYLKKADVKDVLIIAAEGCLHKNVYGSYLENAGIRYNTPTEKYYEKIRYFIEKVKQNKIDVMVLREFSDFLEEFSQKNVILGCTEFPVLIEEADRRGLFQLTDMCYRRKVFWNPLSILLDELEKTLE